MRGMRGVVISKRLASTFCKLSGIFCKFSGSLVDRKFLLAISPVPVFCLLIVLFNLAAANQPAMGQATPRFTQLTPAPFNLDLSALLPVHGGTHIFIVGENGNYLASSIAAADLFSGITFGSLKMGTVFYENCSLTVNKLFAEGINRIYVRVSLEDGDSAQGDFDHDDNFLTIGSNDVRDTSGRANASRVETELLSDQSRALGFPDRRTATGWFSFTPSDGLLEQLVATNRLDLYWDKADRDRQFYDFSDGAVDAIECQAASVNSSVTIVVKVINDDGRTADLSNFNVTTNAGTLKFGAGVVSGDTTTWTSEAMTVFPDSYDLSESEVANYTQGNWSCTIDGASAKSIGAYSAGKLAVEADKNIVCTIVNDDTQRVSDVKLGKDFKNGTTYTPGSTGVYSLTVTNEGPDDVTGLRVVDNLPQGVTINGRWVCDPSTVPGDGTASCVSGSAAGTTASGTADPNLSVDIPNGKKIIIDIPVSFASDASDY